MAQQLIVQNDDEEEYVQFTVEVPDGYNNFNVNSINGTMINQNYLNVGDVIRFKFSNNPIVYNQPINLKLTNMNNSNSLKTSILDTTEYKYISLNLFNIYRVKFIPIYSYYYGGNYSFSSLVFNPADDSQLYDEPAKLVPDYTIQANPLITVPFTGKYVIGLKKVDKIDDINVVVGESISNSKTQPSDVTINDVGEIISQNQQTAAYNYGSSWRYDVSNLLMNHVITTQKGESISTTLFATVTGKANDFYKYTTPRLNFNKAQISKNYRVTQADGSKWVFSPTYTFYTVSNDNNETTFNYLDEKYELTYNKPSTRYVILKTDVDHYREIPYNWGATGERKDFIPSGLYLKGSELKGGNYFVVDENDLTISPQPIDFSVKADVYYTGNTARIRIKEVGSVRYLSNKTLTFNRPSQGGYQIITCDGITEYSVHIDEDNRDTNVVIREEVRNQTVNSGNRYILGCNIQTKGVGYVTFISSINTGLIDVTTPDYKNKLIKLDYDSSNLNVKESLTQYLQLTSTDVDDNVIAGVDDIIVKHVNNGVNDGLQLKVGELTNNYYEILSDGHGGTVIKSFPSLGANNVKPKVFLPKRANLYLQSFENGNNSVVDGLMIMNTISGDKLIELNNDTSLLFLADGHETLNVDRIQDDDTKFKTFNGSITFDRSLTKITRLFSMSNSNSCICYLNDILSARLSRYYFTADYRIFDTFINQGQLIPFSNSLNQNESIYSSLMNNVYTGCHEVLLANCGDLVKLIGSDVITNNCMPGITPEDHIINCCEISDKLNEIPNLKDNIEVSDFHYKLFHYYNSGFNNSPGIGGTNEVPYGSSLLHVSTHIFEEDNNTFTNAPNITATNSFYITNPTLTNSALSYPDSSPHYQLPAINDGLLSVNIHRNNSLVDWVYDYEEEEEVKENHFGGIINVLPVPRVYRNNNFEQSDLTISTGRIKTLSPIYIQTVNRTLLNNLIYMIDMMINTICDKYGSIVNSGGVFDYLLVLTSDEIPRLGLDEEAPLRRFAMTQMGESDNYPYSFDSCWLLNYLTSTTVNDYANNDELVESLPIADNSANNEELIEDMITYRPETNIQLFSSRYFNFHENISFLSMVCWIQVINSSLDLSVKNCTMYFGTNESETTDDPTYVLINSYINNFYSEVLINNGFNIVRTVKSMISKLGEFLDYPKIIFGTTLAFNQSKTVNIQYINPVNYTNEFTTNYNVNPTTNVTNYTEEYTPNVKQKTNLALFGVIFKYHQLSLGWQQMINDIQDTFAIDRAKGQRHFVVKIYDEFGRQIPNVDTSQGFKNNLRLELNCYI